MPTYTVRQGDSIASIAEQNGFLWETIWNHGNNAGLKAKRSDPNVLLPGDEVFIPEKGQKQVDKPVDARHRFTRKGVPHKLKVKLTTADEARAGEAYTLVVGDQVLHGTLDGDGAFEHDVPGDAKTAQLILSGGDEIVNLRVGGLDPVSETSGAQQRLKNLGYDVGGEQGTIGDKTRAALRAFQDRNKLPVTGELDGATKAKLQEVHK